MDMLTICRLFEMSKYEILSSVQILRQIYEIATAHPIKLNPSRSRLTIFGNNAHRNLLLDSLINININNNNFDVSESVKNFGLLIDRILKYLEHILKYIQKAYFVLR